MNRYSGATVRWPGAAGLAVNLVLNFEEGAEFSPRYGDAVREMMSEVQYPAIPGSRDLLQESIYDYGAQVGAWRIMELFDEYSVPSTIFACGAAVERHPDLAKAMAQRQYDFVGHGYRWQQHLGMQEDEELESIRRTAQAIREVTGETIAGWFTRPLPSPSTRRLVVREGMRYDCDSYGADVPYYVVVDDSPHLVVPYTIDVNDIRYWRGQVASSREWYTYARDAFDTLYAESQRGPRIFSVGLHGRISGRPGRIVGLRMLLDYVLRREGVWVCKRTALADHWLAKVRPPASVPTREDT
jgi:peptidoglycan/xylan/chitin deacetylase (PgdA/CDA1 family)